MATPSETGVDAAWTHGRAAWPDVELERDAFDSYLRAHPGGELDPSALDAERAAELYLACACAAGEPHALAHFDQHYLGVVRTAVAHMKLPYAIEDDVRQAVRTKLLVGVDGPPRLLSYAGQGRLRGLVQVMAVRLAISALRSRKREVPLGDDLTRLPGTGNDPELDVMKASYREVFKRAFEVAAGELDSRQRNLLRLHLLGGVTLEQLATMYGVHRATVVRWLARARSSLLAGTRKEMQRHLQIDRDELDSLMGLIQSRLDASVHRLLATTAPNRDEDDDLAPVDDTAGDED